MYLATLQKGSTTTYQIRLSHPDSATDSFRHRLIFDLGEHPTDHMEFMGEAVVFFSTELEHAVGAHTSADSGTLLEKLLWNFLPRPTRERLSRFDRSDRYVPGPLSPEDRKKIAGQIHIIDRRRLYYLHFGAIDQSSVFTMNERVYRPLLDQSRDEREYHFATLEKALNPEEYRNYLYAIFNVQTFFSASYASFLPEALPKDEVADHFIEALCRLNTSPSFWQYEPKASTLHPHLVRYLVMFFDFTTRNRTFEEEYIRRFINSHRTFRWPERQAAVSEERINQLFGQPLAQLKKLQQKELRRLYRQRAKELHPDRGGDQDRFVELTEVYNSLLLKT